MALWGISSTTETAANSYNLPKYVKQVARADSRHDVFADVRGWVQRHYKSSERSGISTRYYDEVLVPVIGLAGTGGYSVSLGSTLTGLALAQPVAVFFEDPNRASNISVGSGGTTGIGTGRTGYVHVVFNELVFAGAGATVVVQPYTAAGVTTGTAIVATAASVTPGATVANWTYNYPSAGVGTATGQVGGPQLVTNYNGQITNRVAFAFTAPSSGIGTVLRIDMSKGFIGVITDIYFNTGVTSSFSPDLIRNVGGAGTFLSVQRDGVTPVGLGTTTLTLVA
jgi:hypothetical protein